MTLFSDFETSEKEVKGSPDLDKGGNMPKVKAYVRFCKEANKGNYKDDI